MFNNLHSILLFFKEKNNSSLSKIISNISWLLAERVLRMVVSFFVLAWTARYLGADQFGLFNYAIAFVSIFLTLSSLGLNHNILVNDLVREPENKDEILGTAFYLRFWGGVVSCMLAVGLILLLRPDDLLTQILVSIIALTLLFQESQVIDFWFQAKVESKYAVWVRNIVFITLTLVRIILIKTKASLIAFCIAFLVESFLTSVGLFIAYKWTKNNIQALRFSWSRAKSLMQVSWPLIFSSLAITIYLRVDQVMLGQLSSDSAVGIYSVVVRLSEVWLFFALAIVRSVTPSIIELKKVDNESYYYDRIQKIAYYLALIAYGIAIPVTLLSTPLVTFVFGQEYEPAGFVLALHVWSAIFVFQGYLKGVWIASEKLTKFALVSGVTGALANVALNFWLIPIYQALGAAIATVISYCCADYLVCFLYPPSRKMGVVITKALLLRRS